MFSKSPIFKFVLGEDVRKAVFGPKEVNAFDEGSIKDDAVRSNIVLEEIIFIVTKMLL